jgi:hypothetical protein
MRKTERLAILILCLLAPFGSAPGAADPVRRSVATRTRVLAFPSDSTRFNLPGEWIRPETFVAVFDSMSSGNAHGSGESGNGTMPGGSRVLARGIDYDLDAADAVLRLLHPLPAGRLRLRYEIVPIAIGRIFQTTIPIDPTNPGDAPIPPKAAGPLDALASRASRLEIRGSKTVSLEFGSAQDLTVRQSLDVALSGEVVPGVSVRGVLSDRETPLQPEGRTTELSDLDRLFLEVQGPGASMTLGDFQLRGPEGLFTGYERQLEGVRIQGRRGPGSLTLVAASIPGIYTTVEFLGEEGKQGPYSIRPGGSSFDAVVIAGSERVWVDGDLLVRGEDRDYMIDYAASTVTFTGRRIMTGASRVTVDLQTSSQPYKRNAYAAEAGWGAAVRSEARGFGVRATLLSEHDDRARPIGGPLTAAERAILQQAGDTLHAGIGSGVDCGEIGHGDYTWVEADSLHTPFLKYVGDSVGTCLVRFDDVGSGKGDYADSLTTSGRTIYRYTGVKRGRFLPGRAVPLPSSRDLLDFVASYGGANGLRMEMEGAGSVDDPNTYSAISSSNHNGGALRLHLHRDAAPIRLGGVSAGRWGLDLESRDLDPQFRSLGRIDPGWIGYDWGVASSRLIGGDRRRKAILRNEPGLGFAIEGALETMSNRRDLEGERNRISIQRGGRIVGDLERTRATTRDRLSGTEIPGSRAVDHGSVGLRLPRAESTIEMRREENVQGIGSVGTGSGFKEWRASAAWLIPEKHGRFELTRADRKDRGMQGSRWEAGDRSRTYEAHAAFAPTGRVLDARYSRRDLFAREGGVMRSDVAGVLWSQEEGQGRFSQQVRGDLTTSREDTRRKVIQFAGAGRGHYDSLGVYVGTGDYDVVLVPSGTSATERRLDASWRIELAPGRGGAEEAGITDTTGAPRRGRGGGAIARAFERAWSTSQYLLYANFGARTGGSASEFWRDLPSLLLARKDDALLANHRIRAEASALPQARWLSPQIRLERERGISREYENVQARTTRDLLAATLRSNPGPAWTIEQELQVDRDRVATRLFGDGGALGPAGSSGFRSSHLRAGGWYRPSRDWTVRFSALGRRRDRDPGGEKYRVYQMVPGVQWLAARGTRLDLQATRTWVIGPPTLLYGLEREGWEARGNIAVRLRSSLDATATWNLTSTSGSGRASNSVRAEMRATF